MLPFAASPSKITIAQIAPAVRVSIGEELGLPPGTLATGKLVAALRKLGFDYVFDVVSAADMTIMEEGTEFLHRLRDKTVQTVQTDKSDKSSTLPMMTSCCPGWIEFVEKCAPQFIPNLSSAKSPHMMGGSLIKEFFSQQIGHEEKDLSVTSIMPCVRKQGEADRIFFQTEKGARQVDHVLTTREIGALINEKGIDFASLQDEHFDDFLGISTGSGTIFGTTGGVMEAALRTVVELANGKPLPRLDYVAVRGMDGVKEATVTIESNPSGPLHNDQPVQVHVAVANGLGNAKKLLKSIEDGSCKYDFVEVMACPGGCIGGGGQPRSKDKGIILKRQQALYAADEGAVLRRSHENPVVQNIYDQYLTGPGSQRAHELLHTHYVECGPGKFDITAPPPPPGTCTYVEPEVCEEKEEICNVEDSPSDEE